MATSPKKLSASHVSNARTVILAAIDNSPGADIVLETATRLAKSTYGAELHIANVYTEFPLPISPLDGLLTGPPDTSRAVRQARELIEARVRAASKECGKVVRGHAVAGTPWRAIVQLGVDLGADVLIVGTHDRTGIERFVIGSVAETIVRRASCAVMVVREKKHQEPDVPEIEPPCPDCVAVQRASAGASLWCARHSERHPRGHLHYEYPTGFASGSMTFRSE